MTPDAPILIVDDEADLRELVDLALTREGFRVVQAADGLSALEAARRERPALVVLDMMLPDLPGTEVCRRLRASADTATVPVIMLSARGEEIDRVVGFEVGADDYVVKSNLSTRELALRVRAVLRRRAESPAAAPLDHEINAERVRYGDLEIARDAHRVWVEGEEVVLTATEFKLLLALVDRAGRVFTRGALLQHVWDMAPDLNTRTVDTHVKRLREKLGAAADYVETVRGVGYRFASKLS
jgi:two-component system, OmpR family, phosphate regulon response regulator PhoB